MLSRGVLLPWQRVEVSGPSMAPTLAPGDVVLVRHGAPIRPGDVVLARFRELPDRYVIKRVQHAQGDGWYLRSDNQFAAGDSAIHGLADVFARAVLVWPGAGSGRRRWVPRRIH